MTYDKNNHTVKYCTGCEHFVPGQGCEFEAALAHAPVKTDRAYMNCGRFDLWLSPPRQTNPVPTGPATLEEVMKVMKHVATPQEQYLPTRPDQPTVIDITGGSGIGFPPADKR